MSYLDLLENAPPPSERPESESPPDRCPRCAAFIREARARDPRADSLCRSCPAWEPTFRAVVPPEVLEARRAGKREYARLVAAGVAPAVAAAEADRVAESILADKGGAGE